MNPPTFIVKPFVVMGRDARSRMHDKQPNFGVKNMLILQVVEGDVQ